MPASPKTWLAGVAAAALLSLLAKPAAADGEKIIAAFHNLAEPFYVFMNRELLAAAQEKSVEVAVLDAQASSPKQTADVENALVQGVDGIILAPVDVQALASAADEVIEEEIPLVTVDRRVEGTSQPVPHVGADNVAGGRKMAEWVLKNFPEGANIVMLTGAPGSSSGIDRAKGMHEVLDPVSDKYKIVAEQTGNWERAQGLTVTEGVLTSLTGNPPNAILAANDDMALGAAEAVHGMGLGEVKVLGFDATPEALKAIKAGTLAATVEQSPSKQIRTALDLILGKIREGAEMRTVLIEPQLITTENLQDAERIGELGG